MKKNIAEPLTPSICRLSRLSTLFMGREMTRIGFGAAQFPLLSEVYNKEGQSQDELSVKVGIDKSNTSRALAKLEKYGLIRRTVTPENHKEKRVYLTEKAKENKRVFKNIQMMWSNTLLAGFSEDEKRFLYKALNRMLENAHSAVRQKIVNQTSY